MFYISDKTEFYSSVLQSKKPVFVEFFGKDIAACRRIANDIEKLELENRGRVDFAGIDVGKDMTLAQGYNVSSVPTIFIFKDGEIVKKQIGLVAKDKLQNMLDTIVS